MNWKNVLGYLVYIIVFIITLVLVIWYFSFSGGTMPSKSSMLPTRIIAIVISIITASIASSIIKKAFRVMEIN
jgi:uncharacterized phage infection (PIP) family protein YhgE